MFRRLLLATSALVFAGSMSLAAGQHGKLSRVQQVERAKRVMRHAFEHHMPGVIFNRNNIPVAVRLPPSAVKPGAQGKEAGFVPGGKGFSNFSKSKNALFFSYFGWFAGKANISVNSSYSSCISYNSNYSQCLNYEHVHASVQALLTQSVAEPFAQVKRPSAISIGAEQYSGTGGAKVAIYKDASGAPGTPIAGASGTFSGLPSFNGLCCAGLTTVTFAPVSLKRHRQYWVVVSGTKKTDGRLVWISDDCDDGKCPGIVAYKAAEHVYYSVSERTSKSGYSTQYSGSYNTGTGGWIHTTSFSYSEPIFSVTANAGP